MICAHVHGKVSFFILISTLWLQLPIIFPLMIRFILFLKNILYTKDIYVKYLFAALINFQLALLQKVSLTRLKQQFPNYNIKDIYQIICHNMRILCQPNETLRITQTRDIMHIIYRLLLFLITYHTFCNCVCISSLHLFKF